jgi:GntR family transcriptional repressor for pyruvate dehydrogenase complex
MANITGISGQVGRVMRAPKTGELIAADLRRQIVRGQLLPGDVLPPEARLMDQYGVSRPTLREAYRILETELLIRVRRGSRGGAHVLAPDLSIASRSVGLLLQLQGTTIEDVYHARLVSEPVCAGLLAARHTDQDLKDLRAVVDELKLLAEAGRQVVQEPERWSDLTYRFHRLILERCGNKTLAVHAGILEGIVATHLYLRVALSFGDDESPDRFKRAIAAYERVIGFIAAGDAEGAERMWRRHMEVAATYLFEDALKDKAVVDLFP